MRGSSKNRPRRGTAYVHKQRALSPRYTRGGSGVAAVAARSHVRGADFWRAQLALDLPAVSTTGAWTQRLALACGGDAHAGVPLWNGAQHWARIAVPAAYAARYKQLCADGALGKWDRITLEKLVRVADARALFAEGRTGRHCRPTNETLATVSGEHPRVVQRASRVLKALGCATEVLRGRQRTKAERLASWRMGDRSRGWASVWALHPPIPVVDNSRDENGLWDPVSPILSPHPRRGSISGDPVSFSSLSPTENAPQERAGHGPPNKGGAARHSTETRTVKRSRFGPVDEQGRLLAVRWLATGQTPAWAGRFTPRGWAKLLAAPAAADWTPEDINTMIREWASVGGNYLPPEPYRPHGLLGAIFKAYGDLANRPAAHAQAQAAEQRAAESAHIAARRAAASAARPANAEHRAALRTSWRQMGHS
ncbi:repa [Mycobacteroides abscessus subsp. abscessus]|nr:repa [Mycobacteroides abscessus subsp. abscessus]MBN7557546.1 repa [Mycobacteroides abscessus subsp. abscessus]QSM56153.1 repa [Mycobacteroides abscessus subsp. abscessus]QSN23903.1 repa [Mycobacteroides abscessus subsp. abscessus]RWU53617.1 repa [Mycobacteroides abscessus subsp. abscessus]